MSGRRNIVSAFLPVFLVLKKPKSLSKMHSFSAFSFLLLPVAGHSLELHPVSPFQQEHFKARRAPTEQVLFSQFPLLCHLLETFDGRHPRKHTTKPSGQWLQCYLRNVLYALSLEPSLPIPRQLLKTGTYSSPPYLVKNTDQQS